jgi:coproporphyrinogen III oxidase
MTGKTAGFDADAVRHYLTGLRVKIVGALERFDGKQFKRDAWERGMSCVIEEGNFFERGGVNFSHVTGDELPPSATAHRPELAGRPWEAMGVSLVLHPRNPYCPTAHANVRCFVAYPALGDPPDTPPIWWFGGGMDMTPYYGFEEDARHFHQTCKDALAPFGKEVYPRYKQWCDEYFFLKHRQEPRGIGGIFFDDLRSGDGADAWERDFAFVRDVGTAFLDVYPRLVRRHMTETWTAAERQQQLVKRGRYVEFNLLYDRGTKFGLMTGGNVEAILMSLPPEVAWP